MATIRNSLLPPTRCFSFLAAVLSISLAIPVVGCTQKSVETLADQPPFREIVGTRLLMIGVIDPAVDVVWDAVKSIITAQGIEEIQPQTDEEWIAVRNAAIVVGEAGNLLMLERRAEDNDDWMLWALDLVDAGKAAMIAAESRDPEAVFDAGGQLYEACLGCHESYWAEGTENVMPERPKAALPQE